MIGLSTTHAHVFCFCFVFLHWQFVRLTAHIWWSKVFVMYDINAFLQIYFAVCGKALYSAVKMQRNGS